MWRKLLPAATGLVAVLALILFAIIGSIQDLLDDSPSAADLKVAEDR